MRVSVGIGERVGNVPLELLVLNLGLLGTRPLVDVEKLRAFPSRAPAYAIDKVADPFPSFAFTTSVPASCTRLSIASMSEGGIFAPNLSWEKTGMMVAPAWPPMTLMSTSAGSQPTFSATNLFARTTSRVVMPTMFFGLRPFFL